MATHSNILENPMDRGAWQAAVHGVTESDMTECTEREQLILQEVLRGGL